LARDTPISAIFTGWERGEGDRNPFPVRITAFSTLTSISLLDRRAESLAAP